MIPRPCPGTTKFESELPKHRSPYGSSSPGGYNNQAGQASLYWSPGLSALENTGPGLSEALGVGDISPGTTYLERGYKIVEVAGLTKGRV